MTSAIDSPGLSAEHPSLGTQNSPPTKFVVLCGFETPKAFNGAHDAVLDQLKAARLDPVGYEITPEGLAFGLPTFAIGEFLAHDTSVLKTRLESDLRERFSGLGFVVDFTLFFTSIRSL